MLESFFRLVRVVLTRREGVRERVPCLFSRHTLLVLTACVVLSLCSHCTSRFYSFEVSIERRRKTLLCGTVEKRKDDIVNITCAPVPKCWNCFRRQQRDSMSMKCEDGKKRAILILINQNISSQLQDLTPLFRLLKYPNQLL